MLRFVSTEIEAIGIDVDEFEFAERIQL